ncbi:MAG: hypothetical protein V9E90_08310 [Saprospiraceae bacterium]
MRIVIFSHNYPPKRNPRSFRIQNLEQSGFFGKEYLIISTSNLQSSQSIPSTDKLFINKWNYSKLEFLLNIIKRIRYNQLADFISKCIIPDRYVFIQIYYLILYLVKFRKADDLIYTVSNPFSSHLIGIVLQKYFKHEWHADIGDVYFSPMTSNWCIHQTIERKVLVSANRIILNCESIRNHFIKVYSINKEKTQLVPNGVNIKFENCKPISSPILRFSFIGNTYHPVRPGIREVYYILKYIQTHSKRSLILQLFGKQDQPIVKLAKQNPLLIKISYCNSDQELEEAYANSDILINFANVNHPGLPSKLEEYVASGIPIINFIHTERDSSCEYLSSKQAKCLHINCSNDVNQDYSVLERFISN